MAIDVIKNGFQAIKPVIQQKTQTQPSGPAQPEAGKSFSEMFSSAIKEVDQMQKNADNQIEGLMLGKPGVSTHEAMLALEKADVAFQLMSQIRGKILRAYEEVMRTTV